MALQLQPFQITGQRSFSTSSANITTTTTTPVSSPNNVYLTTSGDANPAALNLITPPIGVNLNTLKTKFYARSSSAGYTLIVGTVNNNTPTVPSHPSKRSPSTSNKYSIHSNIRGLCRHRYLHRLQAWRWWYLSRYLYGQLRTSASAQ